MFFQQPQQDSLDDIVGDWVSLDGRNSLSIYQETLKLNNLTFSFCHQQGTLFVRDNQNLNVIIPYPYVMKERSLIIQFPGPVMVIFMKKEREEVKVDDKKENKVKQKQNHQKTEEEEEVEDIQPVKGTSIEHSLWSFFLKQIPLGWKHSQLDNTMKTYNVIFGHDVIPGMIILSPRSDVLKIEEMNNEMKKGLNTAELVLTADPRMKLEYDEKGKRCAGFFNGTTGGMQGMQITRAYVVGRICPFSESSGGVTVLGIANQNVFSQKMVDAVTEISENIIFKKDVKVKRGGSTLMNDYFAGKWKHIRTSSLLFSSASSSSTDEFVLMKDGRFYQNSEYSFSGNNTEAFSNEITSSYMGVNQDKSSGTYKIVGDQKSGMMIFYDRSGGMLYKSQYTVHEKDGVVYEREYFFDGKLYFKEVQ